MPDKISTVVMPEQPDYATAVTNVPCPACATGIVRWAEAGRTAWYRICDGCGQHWIAKGNTKRPLLAPVTEVDTGCFGAAREGEEVDAGQPYRGSL